MGTGACRPRWVPFAFAVFNRDVRRVDEVTGINGAYLFGEEMRADLSGFVVPGQPCSPERRRW